MGFLEKLQNLPEEKRKIILWTAVIIIGLLLFTFYIKGIEQRLKGLSSKKIREQLRVPEFQERLRELPKLEIPEFEVPEISEEEWQKPGEELSEEEIKILEEILKEGQE